MSELQTELLVRAEWLWQDDSAVADPSERGVLAFQRFLAYGAAAFQCEKRWRAVGSIAGAGTTALNLQALSLESGGLTGTISFSTVKLIVFSLTNILAAVKIGGVTIDEWFAPWQASGRGQLCGAGSPAVLADLSAGWAVTAGAKSLLLANQSATETAEYQIAIFGN
jgi:hypothetical protein